MCLAVLMTGSAALNVTTLPLFKVIKILKSLKSQDFWFQEASFPVCVWKYLFLCKR